MVDLAAHYGQGPVLVRSIAERQGLSGKYLHALLASLKSAKLVRSVRGSGGGYALTREPKEIHLQEIVEALEGPITLVDCAFAPGSCERSRCCAVREVWQEMSETMQAMMAQMTLQTLLERQLAKEEQPGC